ncbi:b, exonuclease domain protein, DNA polymerase family [Ancylostoma duodenale]|uniref:DNA polymerase delta catalytic subunit n=1 Tax=Ancylostoma duodenale TaxID=51022 RepID=A0A0C2GSU4_9BILA|nr:b, exonuclease domain protein, DNA polymerase family [Ancylostoma duodenale]
MSPPKKRSSTLPSAAAPKRRKRDEEPVSKMSPPKKRSSTLPSAAAPKRRKRDEEPASKGAFESQLEQLSQNSEAESCESSWDRADLEEGLGTTKAITLQAPENFAPEHLDVAQRNLNNAVAVSLRRANSNLQMSSTVVDNLVRLSIVHGENVYYYRGSEKKYPFIKVSGTTNALNKAKQELKNGGFSVGNGPVQVTTLYEANIDAEVKFMAHSGIVGCGWVEIPAGKGVIHHSKAQSSRCQLEVEVKLGDLIVHDPEGEWAAVAPIRTLSFDIECMGRRGIFPDANEDPVIQIANMVKVEGESEPFIRNCFVLGTCSPVIGSDIIQCSTEKELLEK